MNDQSMLLARLIAVALLILIAPVVAHADSWSMPERRTYDAADGSARLTVWPRDIESQPTYYEDKVERREPAGQRRGSRARPQGKLEIRGADGRWQPGWEIPLVNDVAPVSVLIAPGGAYVVTFDNWGSTGLGENVIVIYHRSGRLIRSLALGDLLPEFVIDAMPRSVSSIQWSGDHRFSADGRQLLLQVVEPSREAWQGDDGPYFNLGIDLGTGQPADVDPALLQRLAASACDVHERERSGQLRRLSFMREPLTAPLTTELRDWHNYLHEAVERLLPPASERVAWKTILKDPRSPDYAASRALIRASLHDDLFTDLSFASPFQENLAAEIVREGARIRRGALRGTTIWIAVRGELWPQLERALAASGAQLVRIDPAQPIPQRPDRIPVDDPEAHFPAACRQSAASP